MSRSAEGLRILLTADAVGGVWTYAQDLAAGLAKAGAEVVIAVLGPAPQRFSPPSAGVEVVATDLPLDWAEPDPDALDAAGRALASLAEAAKVDLVHLNSPSLAVGAGFRVPVVGGCHSCLATWWDAVQGDQPLPAEFQWRTQRLSEGYRACSALIAPSEAFAKATAQRYGFQLQVVVNGRAAPPSPATLSPRRQVAVTAGRLWDAGKGAALLDAAAARMHHGVEAAGSLAGPSDQVPARYEHLRLLGRLQSQEVADLLANSAVFVSTALYEPFGLSVLEAAQAGCALVLSDLPVFRELWDGAAMFVDPADADALARTLDGVLDDEAEGRRLGDLARARAADFTLEAMTAGTLAVYADTLARHARPREAAA